MLKIKSGKDIDTIQWKQLAEQSSTATWFQTEDALSFYSSLPDLMESFCIYAVNDDLLRGVAVGYITKETSAIKQYFTRRAIIIGGPMLADDITADELCELLKAVRAELKRKAIYIETRNFNDYSRWKNQFEECGFSYVPHLNFHIDTTDEETARERIGKHRWKYIRLSLRDGATLVEQPTKEQITEFYALLSELYQTRVKTPLFPLSFFLKLAKVESSRFLLVEFDGKIIGGTVCVCLMNKTIYEWFVCGNDNLYKGIRPSSVATWFGMQYAAQHGYSRFDLMGAGKPDEAYGVRDFKAEFGGELVEHGRFLHINMPLLYNIGKLGVKILKNKKS
mgnify:CR=1 FL=1